MPLLRPYRTGGDLDALAKNITTDQYPGAVSRLEPDTGLIQKGIAVNGQYLLVEECTINFQQEIDQKWFIQGGPRSGVAAIGKKFVEGKITCPVRVDVNGNLEAGLLALIANAETPLAALRIDTNHALSHLGLTADDPGTDNNALLSFDCCLVKKLTITAQPEKGVSVVADVIGMVDVRQETWMIFPEPSYALGRRLSFADCNARRFQSAMRTVASVELSFDNEVEQTAFLVPHDPSLGGRTDQPGMMGVKKTQISGEFVEVMRRGAERETTVHGGLMVGENLRLTFGPLHARVLHPLFKPAEVPFTASFLKRTTKFFAHMAPALGSGQGKVFDFTE